MMIATNKTPETTAPRPYDGKVSFRGFGERAERKHRQIIAQIECCETPEEVDATLVEEDLILDALFLDFPEYHEAVEQAADDHKAILRAGNASAADAGAPAPIPAIAQSPKKEKLMFATNQTEGSLGPWMTWTSNGSAAKGFPPKAWIMRGKDANDNKFEQVIDGFANPCVFDLESLKLGWEKDGAAGQAPQRLYSSHYSVPMERPDQSKKQNGAFAWSNCLQVRVAVSQTQAVTWEQGSFGAYQAFTKLAKQIEAQWPEYSQNGTLLPVVHQTGVETRALSSGSTNIPVLEVVKWVPRPDVLKDAAPQIATQAPEQAAQPAPQPAQPQGNTAAVSAAGGF
jgi:hypothetical protein